MRIGSGPVAADHLLPEVCSLALAGGHKTTISIVVGPSWELREQLREGKIDLLIGLTMDGDPSTVAYPIVEDVVVAQDQQGRGIGHERGHLAVRRGCRQTGLIRFW